MIARQPEALAQFPNSSPFRDAGRAAVPLAAAQRLVRLLKLDLRRDDRRHGELARGRRLGAGGGSEGREGQKTGRSRGEPYESHR